MNRECDSVEATQSSCGASKSLYHASVTLSPAARMLEAAGARAIPRYQSAMEHTGRVGRLEWSLARRPKNLQRHHTAGKSSQPWTGSPRTLFAPAVLGHVPPAREDVHTARSVVAGPCRANMLAPCLFAAYSMLRGLTCTGWPCWRTRFALLIRLHVPFGRQHASF
jgi:hypothetical protein